MVLRIKEREEAIQLIIMDPNVCGKLLTTHQRGYGVDVEALRGRFPLRQSADEGSKMGYHGHRRLRPCKSVFVALSVGFGIYENIQAKKLGRWSHEGPTRVGARLATLWPPRGFPDVHSKPSGCLLVQEKSSRGFHSVWTPFGIYFL